MQSRFQKFLRAVWLGCLLWVPLASGDQVLAQVHWSVLGFTIGENTLDEIQSKLGPVAMFKLKTYAPQRICYRSKMDGSAVVFEAGPSGDWEILTSFVAVADAATLPYAKSCAVTDAVDAKLATPGGLKLGLTKAAVEKLLGQPVIGANGKPGYQFAAKKKVPERAVQEAHADLPTAGVLEKPYLTITSGVELIYTDDKVTSFNVYKVDTW